MSSYIKSARDPLQRGFLIQLTMMWNCERLPIIAWACSLGTFQYQQGQNLPKNSFISRERERDPNNERVGLEINWSFKIPSRNFSGLPLLSHKGLLMSLENYPFKKREKKKLGSTTGKLIFLRVLYFLHSCMLLQYDDEVIFIFFSYVSTFFSCSGSAKKRNKRQKRQKR